MPIRRLSPGDYRNTPWKNGGGVSTTIAGERIPGASPDDWSGVIWQLGRTRILKPAPFSDLSGFERLQVVIGGSGLVLETPDGEIDLRKPFQPKRYDGGTPIVSRLENGPVEVINLIARRDLCAIGLCAPEAGAGMPLPEGHQVICAPDGAAHLRLVRPGMAAEDIQLPDGHALTFDGEAMIHVMIGRAVIATVSRR